jgi:hypothetical protein
MGEKFMSALAQPAMTVVRVPYEINQSNSVFSRHQETIDLLKLKEDKQQLMSLINSLSVENTSWSNNQPEKITTDTFRAVVSFLKLLPYNVALPKISPDGEGSLVMLWEGTSPTLLTIDGWQFHLVLGATTPTAEYKDNVPFGEEIPEEILRSLPRV